MLSGMVTSDTSATGTLSNRQARLVAESVRNTYLRHVIFHSDLRDAEAGTMALWTMHTYVYELAEATPYILVTAPTSSAGKSVLFTCAELLVNNPYVAVEPTPAAIYGAIEDLAPLTFMVDEADMLTESNAIRVTLNAGFQPGPPKRTAKGSYRLYCPKMFCGIAGVKPPLTAATLSRCIQIPIRRKGPNEHAVKLRRRHAQMETMPLREQLHAWAIEAKPMLEWAEPAPAKGLDDDRQQDIWSQLFAIADLIGWGSEARKWAVTLFDAMPKPPDPAVQILHDVKRVLDAWDGSKIPSAVLAERRNALDGRDYEDDVTAQQLGRRLNGFGINPDASPFRPQGGNSKTTPVRGYTVRRAGRYLHQWQDAFERYGLADGQE